MGFLLIRLYISQEKVAPLVQDLVSDLILVGRKRHPFHSSNDIPSLEGHGWKGRSQPLLTSSVKCPEPGTYCTAPHGSLVWTRKEGGKHGGGEGGGCPPTSYTKPQANNLGIYWIVTGTPASVPLKSDLQTSVTLGTLRCQSSWTHTETEEAFKNFHSSLSVVQHFHCILQKCRSARVGKF